MATKAAQDIITIKPIEKEFFKVRLVGDTPLIMHSWSDKAKREMLEAQQGKKKIKKEKDRKNPVYDFVNLLSEQSSNLTHLRATNLSV
jgi:hypothetical protein